MNHLPSRFLGRPALSKGRILPLDPGALTHNIACVSIVVACTKIDIIDTNTDLDGAGTLGMGREKGGEWEERTDGLMENVAYNLLRVCVRVTSLGFSFS